MVEQTLYQRRHADGRQAHERMLSNISHQENAIKAQRDATM